MGGDFAPLQIVAGAVRASSELGIECVLCGREAAVREALERAGGDLEVVDAPDVIPMGHPDPALAVRSMRNSSVSVACRLVKQGRADAAFSAGATGAAMAAAVMHMGRVRGVGRPAVTVVLPFPESPTVLLDAGANVEVRPDHMLGFAVMGSLFAEVRLEIEKPRVGLLSIGEEPGKGSDLVKAAFELIEAAGLNFVGNVEGRDIPSDRVDVVVTDGFTGNVALKLMEGFATFLMAELLKIFGATEQTRRASQVLLPGLLELRSALSTESQGGAQLLGVNGVCIIGHGASSSQAAMSAIDIAAQTADAGFVARVTDRLGGTKREMDAS
jgi:glycerol-3-phosphate acyltransferase PlsX